MKYNKLGKTNLEVSQLGFGALFIASFAQKNMEEGCRAIKRAAELGVNYFDTAPGYGDSEQVLGEGLARVAGKTILSTKLGGRPLPFLPRDRDCLMRSVEESLKALKRDALDIVLVHEPDRRGQYDWWTNWERVEGPVLDVLADLKRQKIIRHTGVGGTTTTHLAHIVAAGKFDVVLTAFNYSALFREAALEIFPAAKATGTGVILGSPLQQGATAQRFDALVANPPSWLSKPRATQFKALYEFLDDTKIPLPELGLRFAISNDIVDCVLMGANNTAEVEANVAAIEKGPLPQDMLKRLDEIAAMVPFRPFNEPAGLGWALRSPNDDNLTRLGSL